MGENFTIFKAGLYFTILKRLDNNNSIKFIAISIHYF